MEQWLTGGKAVLHVADDAAVLEGVAAEFDDVGLETVKEPDPVVALRRVRREGRDIACVVAEYDLSEMTGLELLDAVRALRPNLPFVLFTDEGSESLASEAIETGVTDYVPRSGEPSYAELRERVLRAIVDGRTDGAGRRLDKLLARSEEVVLVIDSAGDIALASPNLERVLGYDPSEVEDDQFTDYVHPDDAERVSAQFATLVSDPDEAERLDLRVRHADGSWVVVEAWAKNSLSDPDVGGIVAYLRDVTERVEREEWYRALIEHSMDVTSVIGPDGVVRYQSDASRAVFGHEPEAVVGDHVRDHVHEDDVERILDAFAPVLDGDERVAGPETYRLSRADADADGDGDGDGDVRWVESIVSRPETDAVDGFVVNTRGATERVERERTLRRFQAIVDSMEDTAWTVDTSLQLTYANDRLVERMDADREALLGKSAVELGRALVSEGRIGRYREMLESVVSGTEQSKREVFTLDLPVGTRHVEFVASQQAGERGIEGAVCVARDVTDRVETERRLQRQNERLELLNHIVRHDIRHDMTIVSGWLSLLREDVPEETADRFDEVIRAAAHVIELTRAVGEALSVIEADEDISVKPTSLVETLEREVERARDVHPDAEIRVEGELPAVDVSANEMLASVFRNLLVNGITHADGDSPRVTLRAERVDDAVEVRVADEGPGLPEGLRSALESDDRSVADAPGVGVGLYLVEALVDAYGGRIRVEDGEEGSAFRVRLPIAAECTDP